VSDRKERIINKMSSGNNNHYQYFSIEPLNQQADHTKILLKISAVVTVVVLLYLNTNLNFDLDNIDCYEIMDIIESRDCFSFSNSSNELEKEYKSPIYNYELQFSQKSKMKFWNQHTGCELLKEKGISKIEFKGDSFIRHLFVAFALILKDDYETGALKIKIPECFGNGQFEEKKCRKLLSRNIAVCENEVQLKKTESPWVDLRPSNSDLVFWGYGNHHLGPNKKIGANDAKTCRIEKLEPMCMKPNEMMQKTMNKTVFIGTHYRFTWKDFDDKKWKNQSEYFIEKFNKENSISLKQTCSIPTIQTFGLTKLLSETIPDAGNMTYDKVHWGMQVNLMKSQLLLNYIHDRQKFR